MEISKKEFENISNLSALSFSIQDEKILADLEKIISRFETLEKIDTKNVEPTSHVTNLINSTRDDETEKMLTHDEILSNSPEINSGQIKIPRVFDNE